MGFIIFVLVVLALFFSISGRKYPQIPADDKHKGIIDTLACIECHGPGKQYQRKPSHPPKTECFKCHKHKRVKKV